MIVSRDPVTEADLVAYVDDELSPARRIEVEDHLAGDPVSAARIMADLRDRDRLRLALGTASSAHGPQVMEAARRLDGALGRRRLGVALRRIAAVGVLVSAGWAANEVAGPIGIRESIASAPPPAFVGEAFMAHRTTELRAGMASQPEIARFDPAEILSATAITMPAMPAGWAVDDVQVFPSPFGPSVEMAIETEALGRLSLFAVRPGAFDVIRPTVAGEADALAAYWQMGDVAYALVSAKAERRDLDRAAESLAATLY